MEQQLQVFIKVAERESFSRAAEELHMTQPAVSQHISWLEQRLGAKLLDRTNKYVRLNEAGRIVYRHALEMRGVHDRMVMLLDDLQHKAQGSLHIGASYTFGEYVLPHAVSTLRTQYPLIEPTIYIGNTKEIADKVSVHQLDIGIVEGKVEHPHIRMDEVGEDEMVVIVGRNHKLDNHTPVKPEALNEETWIVREPGSGTRSALDRFFLEHRLQPKQLMQFGSTQIIKESVEAGLGITLMSRWAIRKELSLGTLKVLQIEGTPVLRQFYSITHAATTPTKAMKVFLKLLKGEE
ncbi:LysR family transcriptional regulator [Marinicrinis lubricantis]|uniref:LysR family transcriptional regulator n=1 Tax=Marinicrinis lubricantis TaxID=2086470 RepID=A0ABW1IVA1_9BACL